MERRKARPIAGTLRQGSAATKTEPAESKPIQKEYQTRFDISPNKRTETGGADLQGPERGEAEMFDMDRAWDGSPGGEARGARSARRGVSEILVQRAAWLRPADRAIIEACHGEGLTVAAFVRRCSDHAVNPLTGGALDAVDRSCIGLTRATRRKLRALERRLASDRFAFVIARGTTWPAARRRVAVTCIVQGSSMREAARELGMSLHTVRRHMQGVEALFGEHAESSRRAREAVRTSARTQRAGAGKWAR